MDTRLKRFQDALDTIMEISDEFAVRHVQIFLLIGASPGITVSEITEKIAVSQASVSRAVIYMYARDRSRSRSPDLVYYDIPKDDLRVKRLYLTPFGHRTLEKILSAIGDR
jgi:DNA-binding MarR family transcriptional regulator